MVNSRRGARSTAARTDGSGGDEYAWKKGDKGAGKGEGKKGGAVKGSGKGKKGEAKNASTSYNMQSAQDWHVSGAKTVQELEAEMLLAKGAGGSTKDRREAMKHSEVIKGKFCEVKKHSDMGCAVVTFQDLPTRDDVINLVSQKSTNINDKEDRPTFEVSGHVVQCRKHYDKELKKEIDTNIFVAWGRSEDKKNPLAGLLVVEAMDLLVVECGRGQLVPENSFAPLPMAPSMQMSTSLNEMLPAGFQPSLANDQQQQYAAMLQMAWAQQQMQPPHSPAPAQHDPASMLLTPPRAGNMRRDAPVWTPDPVAYEQPQSNEFMFNDLYNQSQGCDQAPAKPLFQIRDPTSGEAIIIPTKAVTGSFLDAQTRAFVPQNERKPMAIVDPKSKQTIDKRGMIFEPVLNDKKFLIIDPSSGSPVQA